MGRWAHLLLHNLLVLLLDGCKQDVVPLVHQELGGGPAAWWGIQDAEGQLLTQVFQVQILVADLCVQKGAQCGTEQGQAQQHRWQAQQHRWQGQAAGTP